MLADQSTITLVAQLTSDVETIQAIDVYAPDAILWDCGLDTEDGRDKIAALETRTPILVLAQYERDARAVWGGNVRGVLNRRASASQIASALESIANGLFVLDPAFASLLSPARTEGGDELTEALTPREMQVLQLLARGLANKTIAQELDISEHTVKFHVNSILAKLRAQSRTDAVVRAMRLGLVTL